MTIWGVVLDPSEVATNRTELDLNTGPIRVDQAGIDWGDAAITAYMAEQKWGATPVDFVVPNRVVTIPLMIGADDSGQSGFDTARVQLHQKLALIQAEGGWLKRESDLKMYADIVNCTPHLPDQWGETGGVETASIQLECLPDFYGDEITLDSITVTGVAHAVLKQSGATAMIDGDYPARCRIKITDTSGHDQQGVLWAYRSRHYDSASTAALFYEAEAMTPLDAAAAFTHSGFSGGKTMRHNSLPAGSWCPVLVTDLLVGGPLTHQGSYRIIARAYSATATPKLRLLWGVGDVAHPTTNDAQQLPGAGGVYLVDLGQVRLDAPPVGGYSWKGVIQALATVQNDPIEIDCLYLVPLDESAGQCVAAVQASPLGINATEFAGSGGSAFGVGTLTWNNPTLITADDGSVASQPSAGTTHYLCSTGHGFAIPAGATISGIQVDIKRGAPATTGPYTGAPADNRVRLVRAGAVEGVGDHADTLTPWPVTLAWKSYGGPTDLWGAAWTSADINSATFGAAISATLPPPAPTPANVDAIRIIVYYTTAGGFTQVADAVVYANRQAELRTDGMFRQDSTGVVEGGIAVVLGDLPRLPPSRLETRPVEVLVKSSRGDLDTIADPALDSMSVQVLYRPCYLARP